MPRGTLALIVAGSIVAAWPAAQATTCSLDPQRAVDQAMKRGWQFECVVWDRTSAPDATVAFSYDALKRPGCSGHTGALPGLTKRFKARFFKHATASQLANGWSVESFQVGGGPFRPLPPQDHARLVWDWSTTQPNVATARHILQLKLKKSGGSCAKVYDEAFG